MTCTDFGRFYEAPLWRLVVTDLSGVTTTWLDKLAGDRTIELVHLGPSTISGRVPSDNPEVNIEADDLAPFLSEGDRLIYAMRRDCLPYASTVEAPYVPRASGLILSVEDDGSGDAPTTRFTAWDPWELLRSRPVLNADGSLPNEIGRFYPSGTTYDEIIIDQLDLMATFGPVGGGVAAFAFVDWGQTAFYGGTVETTAALTEDLTIQQGKSIGDLLDDLVATGEVEPVFDAIYDPFDRPGYLSELSIYVRAGSFQPAAIMSWDVWPRTLVGVNRLRDGRERQNDIVYHAGQGGPAVTPQINSASLARYGDYLRQQFFPGNESVASVVEMAQRTLLLQADGLTTYRLSPAAARAPIPLIEYARGDTVPVYASNRLREPIEGEDLRVQAIPLSIDDDQLERVNGLLVSTEASGT